MPNDAETNDELTRVFRDGSVFDAKDDQLDRYLKHLCLGYVPNEAVRHREMNRCQVINTIKTFRFINSVERSNKVFTLIIILLTAVTLGLSYYSFTQSQESSSKMERLVKTQEANGIILIDSLSKQIDTQNKAIALLVEQNATLTEELKAIPASSNNLADALEEIMAYNKSLKADAAQEARSAP